MIREFLAVAARAALEWALASLLLANGAAFCLIAAAAARLRLGPPCIACARVHRLLSCSSSAATGNERDALRRLLGESLTLGELVTAFRAQRRELQALRAELADERRSRAEAEEYQRQLEEQGELDREAARLAMQLVYESETEKHGLQRQLEACRVRAQLYQSDSAATEDGGGGGGGGCREANGGGDGNGNNYQSLVDFLPGSVYSSSPDLANLLKLYTESGNAGRRRREDYDVPAIAVVEEAEEEEEVAVAVAVMAGTESSRTVDATSAIVSESLQESSDTFHVETVTEAA